MRPLYFLLLSSLLPIATQACTGIVRAARDGSVIFARTMEFEASFLSFDLVYVPRKIDYKGVTPKGLLTGMPWKTQYAHVGFAPFGLPLLADGLNEKGLSCGAFYLPGFAEYQPLPEHDLSHTISQIYFVSWALGTCATTAEVVQKLEDITVVGIEIPENALIPPLHYFLTDAGGHTVVIEYIGGELQVHSETLNTVTNAPGYAWHMTNARNYLGLRALNRDPLMINGQELAPLGQGTGGEGLPGDFTPPSRFIRAMFLNANVFHQNDGPREVLSAFKILNQFDIPKGSVRQRANGKAYYSVTQWTSAADTQGLAYYFHTQHNRAIRMVNLKELDPNAKKIHSLNVDTPQLVEDLSAHFKN